MFNNKKNTINNIDIKAINNLRMLAIDMIDEAKSGHPGVCLGAAPIIYTLYTNHLRFSTSNDKWINRDRFVLSGGHASALLYAMLYLVGFDISISDLKNFRQLGSITPGHPEVNITPGVDASTGPLSEGFANAVGMAISEKFLNKRYTYQKNMSLIDHYTYVMCGDGDLMEGLSYEASSIAGNLSLGKLIVLYDSNDISLDGSTNLTFTENVLERFKAMNWDTHFVSDGENINEINLAISKAKNNLDKPSIIEIKTKIGYGSVLEGTNKVHGSPLSFDDVKQLKEKFNMRDIPFTCYQEVIDNVRNKINERNHNIEYKWNETYQKVEKNMSESYKNEVINLINNNLNFDTSSLSIKLSSEETTIRDLSSIVLNEYLTDDKLYLNGSADLSTSCKNYLLNMGDFTNSNLTGRNINYGVREHAMGAIANGIALSGIRPICSTFLAFSDFLKPAIRMSAIMKLPVIYLFSHDSISIGEDGITHQPVEQLVSLRSIPDFIVLRPSDANELLGSYKYIFENNNNPCALILSKDKINTLEETKVNLVSKGAYVALKEPKDLEAIIISTGNELHTAIKIAKTINSCGKSIRVVSMPSMNLFETQSKQYQEEILPTNKKTIVLEFSSSFSWYKYVKEPDNLITVNSFGVSAKKEDVLYKFSLSYEDILKRIEKLLK